MQKEFEAKNENELANIASYLKSGYPCGGLFLLYGDLGYGKTALVRSFAALFAKDGEVSSPTFAIMNEYGADPKIYHYDFYNFGADSYFEKSMFDYLEEGGYHFMEWPDEKIESFLKSVGMKFVKITIEKDGDTRKYRIEDA